ncbi:uncharacterized protein LAJ45_05932 [Morchella importuna]|uniref:uncharacterized protein n=1 Tax=Morchella importuna TaxID=1174673 RepID=UPI001E8DEDC2|nr:uncharacterized protein LAJ45_05932 [Morchella importuna]KAH8149780.1 hypothetical protein LAJ45_05932 [Morchella importuna]
MRIHAANPLIMFSCLKTQEVGLLQRCRRRIFHYGFIHSVALPVLLIFVTTGIYNIYAFPFTPDARVLPHLPSTFSTPVECGKGTPGAPLSGLVHCTWAGLAPNVTSDTSKVSIWVKHSIEKLADGKARVMLQGKDTRACKLFFGKMNVTSIDILDSPSRAFGSPLPTSGTNQLRLWSREPGRIWRVELAWGGSTDKEDEKVEVLKNEKELKRAVDVAGKLEGRIVCLWSDTNGDEIPAFNEVVTYLPPWATVLKADHGLAEGTVPFVI